MSRIRASKAKRFHGAIGQLALEWRGQDRSRELSVYTYSHGVAHLLAAGRSLAAASLLVDLGYLLGRTGLLNAIGTAGLCRDAVALLRCVGTRGPDSLHVWVRFLEENAHLLSRGDSLWPTDSILLQCAMETAESGPICSSARDQISTQQCPPARAIWFSASLGEPAFANRHLLEGCVALERSDVAVFEESIVVWCETKLAAWHRDGRTWNAVLSSDVLRVGRGTDGNFLVQTKKGLMAISARSGDVVGLVDSVCLIAVTKSGSLLRSENSLVCVSPGGDEHEVLLPLQLVSANVVWGGGDVAFAWAVCDGECDVWSLSWMANEIRGPVRVLGASKWTPHAPSLIPNLTGLVVHKEGGQEIVAMDRHLGQATWRAATPDGAQADVRGELSIGEVRPCGGRWAVQVKCKNGWRTEPEWTFAVSVENGSIESRCLCSEPTSRILETTDGLVAAVLADRETVVLDAAGHVRKFVPGISCVNSIGRSSDSDGFFVVGDRSVARVSDDLRAQDCRVLEWPLCDHSNLAANLQTSVVQFGQGQLLWWDALRDAVRRTPTGARLGGSLTSIAGADTCLHHVSFAECPTIARFGEARSAQDRVDANLHARLKDELFGARLEIVENSLLLRSAGGDELWSRRFEDGPPEFKVLDGNNFLVCADDELSLWSLGPTAEVEERWVKEWPDFPDFAFHSYADGGTLLVADRSDVYSYAELAGSDGENIGFEHELDGLLRWYPMWSPLLLGDFSWVESRGSCFSGVGRDGVVALWRTAEGPIEGLVGRWHTTGGVSVLRILSEHHVIVKDARGLHLLQLAVPR